MDITKFIPRGRDNMISGSDPAQLTQPDSRSVKQHILTFCKLFRIFNAFSFKCSLFQTIIERS